MAEPAPNCAIHYHPDGFDANRLQVKGRHVAGAGFLKGFIDHSGVDRFQVLVDDAAHLQQFKDVLQELDSTDRPVELVDRRSMRAMIQAGSVMLPGPSLQDLAWQRRHANERNFSLCGITHTVSSKVAGTAIGHYVGSPVQSWDALICTSSLVRGAVESMLEGMAEYLAARVGAKPPAKASPIQLPVIPLGVDVPEFRRHAATEGDRKELRDRLGIKKGDVAGLFFGRLAFHAKAHPVPMFITAEHAQKRSKAKLHLILTGQFPNADIAQEFESAAARFCPSVPVHFIDGSDDDLSRSSWAAGDFFISLSDNIQESFGLTPIEAMAAGLPCLVSDWDGYRDTVLDSKTGFRVATRMPPPGVGVDLADRHGFGADTYDRFIGYVSQATAIDIEACTEAMIRLIDDGELRRKMGAAAAERADTVYDWRHIIAAYQDLWVDQAARRRKDKGHALRNPEQVSASPNIPDPFRTFAGYPTEVLSEANRLGLTDQNWKSALDRVMEGKLNRFSETVILPEVEIHNLAARLAGKGVKIADLFDGLDAGERRRVWRTLAWLLKYGIAERR